MKNLRRWIGIFLFSLPWLLSAWLTTEQYVLVFALLGGGGLGFWAVYLIMEG